jgi:hypothetical protein
MEFGKFSVIAVIIFTHSVALFIAFNIEPSDFVSYDEDTSCPGVIEASILVMI